MKTNRLALVAILFPVFAFAQAPSAGDAPGAPPEPPPPPPPMHMMMHGPKHPGPDGPMPGPMPRPGMMRGGGHGLMGKWWENSELAKQLQLTDAQIKQLNQTFLDHRLKLIDYQAEMEKQDLKLQSLLDEDSPNEAQVGSQVDLVLAARSKLERENTMMNLDLRKVLSVEQWRQLKAMHGEHGPGPGGTMFFRGYGSGMQQHP